MMEYKKYFEILGLPYTASEQEVNNAYRDLSEKVHPDAVGDNPELKAQAEVRTKELNTAYGAIQDAFRKGILGSEAEREADLRRFQMTEALKDAQARAFERTEQESESGPAPHQSNGDAGLDPIDELRQAQQRAFMQAQKQPEEPGSPERVSGGISNDIRQAQEDAIRQVRPQPAGVEPRSFDRVQRDMAGFPVIEAKPDEDEEESAGFAEELAEAIGAVSSIDLNTLPKGWASQWGFAFICFAVWALLSAVTPLARLMNFQIGGAESPDDWTVASKDPALYKRWLAYQKEKRDFLSKFYGRPVSEYEAQSWLPPYYLEASQGTAGIDPSTRPFQDGQGWSGELNQAVPPDDPASSRYQLPRNNIPTH